MYLTNGGSIHDRRFLEKLIESGIEVDYVYLNQAGARFAPPGVQAYHVGYEEVSAARRGLKGLARWRVYGRVKHLLRSRKPDVFHAGWIQTCGTIAALSRYRPFLLMPWGSDVLIYPETSHFGRLLTRWVLRKADAITCDCLEVRDRIVEIAGNGRDIVVFPWGVDLAEFRPDAEARARVRDTFGWGERPVVIMDRAFKPVYAVDDFVRAVPRLSECFPDVVIALVGDGPLEADLRRLASDLGVSMFIQFLGPVPNGELAALLNASDVYVSSSLSDGSSLSLLEALACGLPVVVTDVPANLEWIEDGLHGRLVPRHSPIALADAVVDLLLNPSQRLRMREANLDLARDRADWDRNFAQLLETYSGLVGARL
jgi:glycosyltransferase involved in cell wall biosynthesis